MKKILALVLLGTLCSCNRNDDKAEATLEGKWTFYKSELVSSSTGKMTSQNIDDCTKKSIHEFKGNEAISIIYEVEDAVCKQTDVVKRKYTFDKGKMLFWFDDNVDFPYHIVRLTDTDLVVEDRIEDRDNDGKSDVLRRFFVRR